MQQIILWPLLAGTLYMDLRESRIPNLLTVSAALLGLAAHLITSGWYGLLTSLQGLLVGFILLLIPFLLGGIGGGDVKFLAAVGAIMGPSFVFRSCLYGAVVGGLIALYLMIKEKRLVHLAVGAMSGHYRSSQRFFPYGLALVSGAILNLGTGLMR
ncbi:MAG: prepilin peptidase [Bacillota bacterium]